MKYIMCYLNAKSKTELNNQVSSRGSISRTGVGSKDQAGNSDKEQTENMAVIITAETHYTT
ncbi:MAG TPA: hypothetical protein VLV18_08300 [Terriglobales bacterium]|nr:hypothetical protein [Terriglobales bacterium]